MRKLFTAVLILSASMLFGQIVKTGGILYSNGNPNTRGLDTLTLKNLNRNSEVAVDVSTGSMSIFSRADSSYKEITPYKVYTAIIKLDFPDSNNVIVNILNNTLGDIIWTASGGTIYATLVDGFTLTKTWVNYTIPSVPVYDQGTTRPGVYLRYADGSDEDDDDYLGFSMLRLDNNENGYYLLNTAVLIEIRVYY